MEKQQWQYSTNADQLNEEVLMRMPKWSQNSLAQGTSRRYRQAQQLEDDEENSPGGDVYQQNLIQPRQIDEETQALIDAVEGATQKVTKQVAMELKNLNNPPEQVLKVLITLADFVEDRSDSNFGQAKAKVYDLVRRGVGARDRVSEG